MFFMHFNFLKLMNEMVKAVNIVSTTLVSYLFKKANSTFSLNRILLLMLLFVTLKYNVYDFTFELKKVRYQGFRNKSLKFVFQTIP